MPQNHLTKQDLRNTVSRWLGGDTTITVADANAAIDQRRRMEKREQFKTKRTERVICVSCGYRIELKEFCEMCNTRVCSF